jgi:integrase
MRGSALPARVPKAHSAKDCSRSFTAAENIPWRNAYEHHLAIALFATILSAGLRRGELIKLQFIDVNLEAGTIRISRGKGRAGGKDRMAYFGPELRHILLAFVKDPRRRMRPLSVVKSTLGNPKEMPQALTLTGSSRLMTHASK